MANPQLENGYTKISNELLEAIISTHLSNAQASVLLAIIRNTYGFGKKAAELSVRYLAQATNNSSRTVARALKDLTIKNIVKIIGQGKRKANILELNKDYEKWIDFYASTTDKIDTDKNDICQNCHMTEMSIEPMTKMTTVPMTEMTYKKEINKKRIKENIYSQQVVDEYHKICISFPRLKGISDKREKSIEKLQKKGIDFTVLFTKAESSDFLSGRSGEKWRCNFDWLMNYNNALKVIEGTYDNKPCNSASFSTDKTIDLEERAKRAGFDDVEEYKKHVDAKRNS